ncbi:hypothetical protein T265_10349 [Opisthorchis viverrini]|uniref:Uncharacterized protein n=1 Tax=Opisthorchis viverrini TaxID=6198 RepID=A0A074Z2T1_OPIVI|nr:hypothetical protein T265_10349 [Opisthorchis viverrini]KER21288.1 hypothetical protein T265_10349 [Opisthorchis viverrini]
MHTAAKRRVPRNGTQPPVQIPKDHCQCSALIGILDAKIERLSKALEDSGAKNAATWAKVDKEHSSLNQYLAMSIPGPMAEKKVIQLSDAAIKTATASLVERRLRENRLIIWGSFSGKITPAKLAQSILSKPDQSLHAEWLRQEGSKRTLGLLVTLSSPSDVQAILERAGSIQKAIPKNKTDPGNLGKCLDPLQTIAVFASHAPYNCYTSNLAGNGRHPHSGRNNLRLYVLLTIYVNFLVQPRSSCYGNAYTLTDCNDFDGRCGAVLKPKYISAMKAWRCLTLADGTLASILFLPATHSGP